MNKTEDRAQVDVPATSAVDDLPPNRDTVAIVPHATFAERYISRVIAGIGDKAKTDLDMFDYAFEHGYNLLISGPTGSGKTSASLAWAASRGKKFYSTPSSVGLEPSQLFGRWVREGETFVWQDGPVTHLVRVGGLLLLNEFNFIPPRVSTVLFSLLDLRRTIQLLDHGGEVIRAHGPNCWCDEPIEMCREKWLLVVGDYNPEYAGTSNMNEALKNRFAIQQFWDYDSKIEGALVPYPALIDLAGKIREADSVRTPVSTNALFELVEHARGPMGWDFAVNNFVARFKADERPHVSEFLKLAGVGLRTQILRTAPSKVTTLGNAGSEDKEWDSADYDLTIVGTPDNPNPIDFPKWVPEMGIYNVDWDITVDEEDES